MKFLLFLFVLVISVLTLNTAYAESNSILSGTGFAINNNNIEKISIQTSLAKQDSGKLVLDDGSIVIGENVYQLNGADLVLTQNNKSIQLSASSENLLIQFSGRLVMSLGNNLIYGVSGTTSGAKDTTFTSYVLLKQNTTSKPEPNKPETKPVIQKSKKELILTYKQDQRSYWNDNYDIYVKVFDKSANPNPKYDDFGGLLKDASVNVELLDGNGKKYLINGTSSFGVWHGSKLFIENISLPGTYKVTINASSGNVTSIQYDTMILIGTTSNRVTITNGTR